MSPIAFHSQSITFAPHLTKNADVTARETKKVMAVKIRLARRGRKAHAMYDIVVADVRAPRDGRFIEKLGNYNPNTNPATIVLNEESALKWVMDGAQPTDTTRAILSYKGIMMKKHLQVGVNKGAITQEVADKRFAEWLKSKEAKIQAKLDGLSKEEATAAKARMEAETKVKEARTAAIQKKEADAIAAVEAEEAAKVAAEAPAVEVVAEEAAPATEVKKETPAVEVKDEAPAAEVKEEAPAVEAKDEAPAAEAKDEAPAAEAKDEAPAVEAKDEAPAEEAKEETAATEETPASTSSAEATEDSKKEEEK